MWVWGGTAHHPQPSCPLGKGSSVLSAPETVLYKGHVRRTGQARTPWELGVWPPPSPPSQCAWPASSLPFLGCQNPPAVDPKAEIGGGEGERSPSELLPPIQLSYCVVFSSLSVPGRVTCWSPHFSWAGSYSVQLHVWLACVCLCSWQSPRKPGKWESWIASAPWRGARGQSSESQNLSPHQLQTWDGSQAQSPLSEVWGLCPPWGKTPPHCQKFISLLFLPVFPKGTYGSFPARVGIGEREIGLLGTTGHWLRADTASQRPQMSLCPPGTYWARYFSSKRTTLR